MFRIFCIKNCWEWNASFLSKIIHAFQKNFFCGGAEAVAEAGGLECYSVLVSDQCVVHQDTKRTNWKYKHWYKYIYVNICICSCILFLGMHKQKSRTGILFCCFISKPSVFKSVSVFVIRICIWICICICIFIWGMQQQQDWNVACRFLSKPSNAPRLDQRETHGTATLHVWTLDQQVTHF